MRLRAGPCRRVRAVGPTKYSGQLPRHPYQAGKVPDTLSLTDRISDWGNEIDSTSRGRIKACMWANLAGDDLRDEIAESLIASELEEAQVLSAACLKKKT